MNTFNKTVLARIFSHCRRVLGETAWGGATAALDEDFAPEKFPERLSALRGQPGFPEYVSDLARLELALWNAGNRDETGEKEVEKLSVNPSLTLVPISFSGLPELMEGPETGQSSSPKPSPSPRHVMVWRPGGRGQPRVEEAEDIDLLALKIAVEGIGLRDAAAMGGVEIDAIRGVVKRASDRGILLSPPSAIRRESPSFELGAEQLAPFLQTDVFTIQWHITQACDLHCKHCYDRSDRSPMPFEKAVAVLDDFHDFCERSHVRGQVSFTGGNPLLYPHFAEIYKEADDRGFALAILGNPSPPKQLEKLLEIAKPVFFQISLEGLEDHNDYIRGQGHFRRSLRFLEHLKSLEIFSMVMLTLTRDNLEQVLPLGELLRGKADYFTFNRLSPVGEGASLFLPEKKDFQDFLRKYEAAAGQNPVLGLKDNLFNIVRKEKNKPLFGGCTGYGCGAAFNFVAVLPDGEVHACRKFPSPIGNMHATGLYEIYRSDLARKYRDGPGPCRGCNLWPVCRGCLASAYGNGMDIFEEKDPYCFFKG